MGIVKVHNLHLDDKKDKSIKEPLITVLYPRDGCHEIIDAAIRATAQDQEADVLVIDSLELALGELGAFGRVLLTLFPDFTRSQSFRRKRSRRKMAPRRRSRRRRRRSRRMLRAPLRRRRQRRQRRSRRMLWTPLRRRSRRRRRTK
ncbi:hypothetical protein BDQ17DRAFT_621576 [Cyathus striatus]|nr:hypothetical protein BDQ17DRAFT_621576 [Cyathus striatus]